MPLLRLIDVSKSFGGVRALRGLCFELHAGQVHALVGENGAGKSTLVKVITGAHQPDSGTLVVAGQVIAENTPSLARSMGIAAIYQQPALFADLTVAENVARMKELTRRLLAVPKTEIGQAKYQGKCQEEATEGLD